MYIFAKRVFKSRKWGLLGGLLMMFDCFHFAHTRIALVDGFQIFFIILSALFMWEYLELDKKDPFKYKAKYLLLSGTFIGCAMATKWNAAYVAIGLAIVFFVHLFKQYNVNLIKFFKKKITISNITKALTFFAFIPVSLYYFVFLVINKNVAHTIIIIYYILLVLVLLIKFYAFIFEDKELCKTLGICVVGFIIIPVVIYVLCYVLVPTISYYDGTLKGIIDANKMMYDYHSGLDATHPFSSSWYQWPIMAKPVWFYSGNTVSGLRMTITDIGNPAIWWMGIAGFIYLVINAIKKREKGSIYLVIFMVSTFVPYVFIGRLMFMYHYFITIPFLMLGIVSLIKWITEKTKNDKVYYGYIALIIIMFIIFYPVISATPISGEYIDSLKWLSGWYF
jgi:dolichyl-phosphate-mannose--protein O-mannosyl transferase